VKVLRRMGGLGRCSRRRIGAWADWLEFIGTSSASNTLVLQNSSRSSFVHGFRVATTAIRHERQRRWSTWSMATFKVVTVTAERSTAMFLAKTTTAGLPENIIRYAVAPKAINKKGLGINEIG
jgi:hypothetical protein